MDGTNKIVWIAVVVVVVGLVLAYVFTSRQPLTVGETTETAVSGNERLLTLAPENPEYKKSIIELAKRAELITIKKGCVSEPFVLRIGAAETLFFRNEAGIPITVLMQLSPELPTGHGVPSEDSGEENMISIGPGFNQGQEILKYLCESSEGNSGGFIHIVS